MGRLLHRDNTPRADLRDAILIGAQLSGANLTDAWLERVDLTGAWLDGANLTDSVGLSQEQVDAARGDGGTQLPAGLVQPASWGSEDPPEA